MGRRERPLSALLVAATLVVAGAAATGTEMSVYQTSTLPASAAIMNMTSPSVCGCRVRCLTVGFCTAVTAHTGPEGVTCVMTNATRPQSLFLSHESAVSFVKDSGASGGGSGGGGGQTTPTAGTYFLSSARGNDGLQTESSCTREGGTPASISDAQSLADLKTSDAQDGTTDIGAAGIWVFVRINADGNKVFYNNQTVSSSTSGATLDLSVVGDCLRLRINDVLASVSCADLTGSVAYACFK